MCFFFFSGRNFYGSIFGFFMLTVSPLFRFLFRFLMTGVASFFSVTVEGSSRDAVMLAALAVRCEKRIGACVGGWL